MKKPHAFEGHAAFFNTWSKPLAEAHHFIHLITELRVKRPRFRLVRHDLQIQLRTSDSGERAFRVLNQRAGITVAAFILGDRERIHPSAVPVVTHHHRSDQTLFQHADEEKLRLHGERVSNRYTRVALWFARRGVFRKRLCPEREYRLRVALIEDPDNHSASSTDRSIDIIWSISSFVTFSAGMKRSRFGRAAFRSKPSGPMSRAISTIFGPLSLLSSNARSRPSPRSPLKPRSSESCNNCAFRYSPRSRTPSRKPGAVSCEITEKPAAVINGLPLYVPPWSPGSKHATSLVESSAANGTPPPMPLPKVMMSGSTPDNSYANKVPARPQPLCTSSTIISNPCFFVSARKACMNSRVAGITPPST